MTGNKPQLDHVIILLPYKDIIDPPSWLTDHFTVSPGGRHADGKTENRLILFQDGTYAELIAFIDDDAERRKGHWWDKPFGVVDYALTDSGEEPDVSAINSRLSSVKSSISYAQPKAGGRKRPDGVELRWKVTFPAGIERGVVPFWCHDVTPRQNRVPVSETSTTHPCGAVGMAGVGIEIDSARDEQVDAALAAILDVSPQPDAEYTLETPISVKTETKPTLRITSSDRDETTCELTLVILTSEAPPENIHQKIDNGVVRIQFEQIAQASEEDGDLSIQ